MIRWRIDGVDAVVTDRWGGVSWGPYESLDLGLHVGDDPTLVEDFETTPWLYDTTGKSTLTTREIAADSGDGYEGQDAYENVADFAYKGKSTLGREFAGGIEDFLFAISVCAHDTTGLSTKVYAFSKPKRSNRIKATFLSDHE